MYEHRSSAAASAMAVHDSGAREFSLPWGRVTGVGSLPYQDAEEAVRLVARCCPQIPFWPQLPQRGPQEDGIVQTLAPLMPLLHRNSPARLDVPPGRVAYFLHMLRASAAWLNPRHAAGFFALERAVRQGLFPQAQMFKGHLYGPVTLARCIYLNGSPLSEGMEIEPEIVYAALGEYIRRMALWQIKRMQAWGRPVLMVVDEPVLPLVRSDSIAMQTLRDLLVEIRSAGAMTGIHCCALPTPRTIFAAQPDLISFDSTQNMDAFLTLPEFTNFVRRGGWLAWGLVPTLTNLDSIAPSALFTGWLAALARAGFDLEQVASQSLITATCGLGLLNEDSAEASFSCAEMLAKNLQCAGNTVHPNPDPGAHRPRHSGPIRRGAATRLHNKNGIRSRNDGKCIGD